MLALSSTMVAIGLLAALGSGDAPPEGAPDAGASSRAAPLVLDDRTPEAVAESYYDAWRRRAWDEAARMATGEAREAALQKKRLDAEVDPADRAMAREVWERLASAPLEVRMTASEILADGALALDGVAAYRFMGAPYRRRMRWEVVREAGAHRVRRMQSGEVLTETPALLRGVE